MSVCDIGSVRRVAVRRSVRGVGEGGSDGDGGDEGSGGDGTGLGAGGDGEATMQANVHMKKSSYVWQSSSSRAAHDAATSSRLHMLVGN